MLTKEQREKFIEVFVSNEIDILNTYTQEDLQQTLGKDIPDIIVNNTVNWKSIEQYLIKCAKKYKTIGEIERDFNFDEVYCEIFEIK